MASLAINDSNEVTRQRDDSEASRHRIIKVEYSSPSESIKIELTPDVFESIFTSRGYGIATSASIQAKTTEQSFPSLIDPMENESTLVNALDALLNQLKSNGIDIQKSIINREYSDLQVQSNNSGVYSLPWESLSNSDLRLRITRISNKSAVKRKITNFNHLFLLSYGHVDHPREYDNIADDFNPELEKALTHFLNSRADVYKPYLITVVKHINRETVRSFNFSNYANLHIMLHGNENGDIGFEDPDDQWRIRWIKPSELALILGKQKYSLLFLSCCYSGYSQDGKPSLAQTLVDNEVAQNVIAFNGKMGSTNTIPEFVDYFYDRYIQTMDAVTSFHKAVDQLYVDKNQYAQRPVLYIGGNV